MSLGQSVIKGFDVHSLLRVKNRCVWWEGIRRMCGGKPTVDPSLLDTAERLGESLYFASLEESTSTIWQMNLRRATLGPKSVRAARELLEYLLRIWPEHFGHGALTKKLWRHFFIGILCFAYLVFLSPKQAEIGSPASWINLAALCLGPLAWCFAFQYNRVATLLGRLKIPGR